MLKYFGADRKISLCREITKIYEEVLQMTLSQAIEYYNINNPKGEFVLVVEGKQSAPEEELTFESALEKVQELISNGTRTADACKQIAKVSKFSKSELYTAINR